MPRRKVSPAAFFWLAVALLLVLAAMDLVAPGSYIRAAVARNPAPVVSPAERVQHLFERFTGQPPPRNPLPRR